MLRQNRYKIECCVQTKNDLELNQDEIILSDEYDIVIALEEDQIQNYEDLKDFIVEISKNIPSFDNEAQDYYETISDEKDFPHSLSVIYFRNQSVNLDYWSEEYNNQFDINFSFENDHWILKNWNGRVVPSDWKSKKIK